MKTNEERYPCLLQTRVPQEMIRAVDTTSRQHFLTRSQYVRSALIRALRDDGVFIEPHVEMQAVKAKAKRLIEEAA